MASSRNLHIFTVIVLISSLQSCSGAPFLNSLPSLQNVLTGAQTAMERVANYANYGYQMLGYGHPEEDHVIVKDKPTLWDGHIGVPDLISPLLASMPEYNGDSERVVKGHDGRVGFRVAVPYGGDFQYIREWGPGRFTDNNLGPGKYPYPGLNGRPKKESHDHYGTDPYHAPQPSYTDPKPQDIIYPEQMYQGLQNYPWNVNN